MMSALAQLGREHAEDGRLIELRFLDAMPVEQVGIRLGFAESTVYQKQRQAVQRLAAVLWSMESQVCGLISSRSNWPMACCGC